eukprot:NODE_4795_length_760_cov_5.469761_g4446_i0.p2 GENE.NODE_4795_length_760_cov_5.469761_g4446_i0~~NODE_4795_length_760_cov_5.469761_g4446_i0.p2  ORF type:complete len:122 (-),score=23.32 NODE_4795_length_760_cov_5.469761_g4446_i0:328-693(-)
MPRKDFTCRGKTEQHRRWNVCTLRMLSTSSTTTSTRPSSSTFGNGTCSIQMKRKRAKHPGERQPDYNVEKPSQRKQQGCVVALPIDATNTLSQENQHQHYQHQHHHHHHHQHQRCQHRPRK